VSSVKNIYSYSFASLYNRDTPIKR